MAEGQHADLAEQAQLEAELILEEANEQARRLLKAAQDNLAKREPMTEPAKERGRELAAQIQSAIDRLTEALEELRRHV